MRFCWTESYIARYFSFFILVCSVTVFVGSKPRNFDERHGPHHGLKNETNSTENFRPSAMDLILAANRGILARRRLHKEMRKADEERVKRMNITKFSNNGTMVIANTSEVLNGTDVMLQENEEQKVADNLLEGDVMLDPLNPDDYQLIKLVKEDKEEEAENRLQKRQAARELKRLWHRRVVPYEIDSSLWGDAYNIILSTISKFNTKSCVKYQPRQREEDYVIFIKNDGCYSNIGRDYARPGSQLISIGEWCKYESTITHEMLHCVGFYHEQSRPDRDQYLKVLWENIPENSKSQFLKYSHGTVDQFGINFDYQSIMQYGRTAFSENDGDTMQAITDPQLHLGGEVMSSYDIDELNILYDCKTTTYNSWSSWSQFTTCDDGCMKSRQRYCFGHTPKSCGGQPNAYGIETQNERCSANVCPVRIIGHWGKWSPYSACTETCNEGVRDRRRTCDNPAPSNGGTPCPGLGIESIICILPRCSLGRYDTDFRDGQLGTLWRNDIYDTPGFDWLVGSGPTRTESTGPSADHFGKNGYYLYIESSGRARRDNARLYTEFLPKTDASCFSFYYHMYGPTTGLLTLSLLPQGGKVLQALFFKVGNQGDKWHFQKTNITSSVSYQLILEATVAAGDYSDMAVDDLFLDAGSCDCQDSFRNCRAWEASSDCINSYDFMMTHCKKSCDFCDCTDKHSRCKEWAPLCDSSYNVMEAVCPVTCRRCVCHNDHKDCEDWKKMGYCETKADSMKKICKRSCGVCQAPQNLG